ncbi:MAG TPA: FtsQ-type POTRA domain-containing protein [Microthrixaceae bacterium]|nr:FtsQ-type POTRA domain-containing protein [Microthrixaceae bacterium]
MIESAVEPRLLERRRQVRADAQRARRRRWMAIGAVAALIAATIGVVLSPLLDVDEVKVSGSSRLSSEAVAKSTGISKGSHLVSVNLERVRSTLIAEPWIASAKVAREYPGTVVVTIKEEQPLLELTTQNAVLVVSRTGRVLGNVGALVPTGGPASASNALPKVEFAGAFGDLGADGGVQSATELIGARPGGLIGDIVVVVKRLPAEIARRIVAIRVGVDKNITLDLASEVEVKFGRPDDIEAKMLAAVAVLSQVQLDCLRSIDVREPTRAAVSRGPGCPGVSPETTSEKVPDSPSESSSNKSSDNASTESSADSADGAKKAGDGVDGTRTQSSDSGSEGT